MVKILKFPHAENLGARLVVFGSALGLAACGQPPSANADKSTTSATPPQLTVSAPTEAASPAAKRASLPIEQGLYGDVEDGGCAATSRVFFYDGSNYGLVRQADQEGGRASAKVYPIERVGSFATGDMVPPDTPRNYEGFAKVWSAELGSPDEFGDVEIEFVGIKATGAGRFVRRVGGHGIATGKFGRFDETYQKCSFSQLSPQMQATIRAERPQLAGGATASNAPASEAALTPKGFSAARPGRLPAKSGLWADDRAGGCSAMKAKDPAFILADDKMLFVQDSMSLTPVKDLGGGRFQTGSRDNGDLQTLHILSPTRMKVQGGLEGSYSWCSASTRWKPWEFDPTE